MGEIDFKKNKERTRKMLKERAELARKEERRGKAIALILLFLLLALFIYIYSEETGKAIKQCIEHGNTEEYCIRATR